MIKKTGPVSDELTWIKKFLNIRLKVLSSDDTWKESVDRVKVYQKLLTNPQLNLPFNVICYGDSFKFEL
jgi:hypothetical protein